MPDSILITRPIAGALLRAIRRMQEAARRAERE